MRDKRDIFVDDSACSHRALRLPHERRLLSNYPYAAMAGEGFTVLNSEGMEVDMTPREEQQTTPAASSTIQEGGMPTNAERAATHLSRRPPHRLTHRGFHSNYPSEPRRTRSPRRTSRRIRQLPQRRRPPSPKRGQLSSRYYPR